MSALLGGLVAGAAVALWWPPAPRGLAALEVRSRAGWPGWAPQAAMVGLLVAVAVALVGPIGLAWSVLVGTLSVTGWLLVVRQRLRSRRRAAAEEVARACQVLAGQLRIGQIPVQALQAAEEDCSVLAEAVAAQAVGGSVPEALRAASRQPGRGGLAALAAAWQLSERSGAPMAATAEEVSHDLAHADDLARSVSTELAAARASGRMMGALPIVGIGMGQVVGADPGHFLLGTLLGQWLLTVAVVLACVGILWTEALADRVERRAWC